ncbi:Ankyrin repeat [Butyrivibrio sp. ob235]|uniref:ankyrin repeat domain-containing protein n=1 Tax=Butyrivibrio sp. ob235 TaxID=1761780 RepID=UPI0008CACB7E|nr:ankyrin repeat domain-containing protein [Butyrivibrio sp. ob235]SEM22504.1 Ankyrin repeat [Butyrivibrio sp. ob235]
MADNSIPFISKRMAELRNKNGLTLEEMALKIHNSEGVKIDKTYISKAEAGKYKEGKLEEYARRYCKALGMSDRQTEQFLRGEKIAIPDTSALLKNTHLVDTLSREYGRVIIPEIVVDELVRIKNNYDHKYSTGISKRAWEVEKSIKESEKAKVFSYTGDGSEENDDKKIITIAKDVVEKYSADVDIISEDVDYSVYLKQDEIVHISALFLREYLATKQNLVNMDCLLKVNEYYGDDYSKIQPPSKDEIDAYLQDGSTLIISCVKRTDIPIERRMKKIKWLIENHADVNKRESANKYLPALSWAIQLKNQDEMVKFLLDECGANPNAGSRNPHGAGKVRQRNEGNMPLMIAAWWGKVEIVKMLCAHKDISINQQDENGFTALIKACANGHVKCRDILIDAGADTRIVDINGKDYQKHYEEFLELGPLKDRFKRNKDSRGRR